MWTFRACVIWKTFQVVMSSSLVAPPQMSWSFGLARSRSGDKVGLLAPNLLGAQPLEDASLMLAQAGGVVQERRSSRSGPSTQGYDSTSGYVVRHGAPS